MSTNMMEHFANKHLSAIAYTCAYFQNEFSVHTSEEQLKAHIQSWHPHHGLAHDEVYIRLNEEDNSIIIYNKEDEN